MKTISLPATSTMVIISEGCKIEKLRRSHAQLVRIFTNTLNQRKVEVKVGCTLWIVDWEDVLI